MASLESLNDDCLREILEYCDTNDHIAFVVAFKQYKPVVQDIWKMFWRKVRFGYFRYSNATQISNLDKGVWIEIYSQRLKIVVDLIQPFVEEIDIIGENKEILDIINASQFTKATMLRLCNTSASPIVKSCFPNLRSLVLEGDSVVKYNLEWNGLENVDVRYSNMSTSEIMEFISQLKLKKLTFGSFKQPIPEQYRNYEYFSELEELSGYISAMKELSNALNVMPKLRKVSVKYEYSDLGRNISIFSKMLGTRSVEFFMQCEYLTDLTPTDKIIYLENQLEKLPNLKRLTLICYDIETINMFSRSCYLHLLKTVILKVRVDAEILTNILISVPQLELLHAFTCTMDSIIHLDVARIAQKRSKPVTINVQPKYSDKGEILLSAPTDLIKITKNNTEYKDYFVQYILEQQ